MHSGRQLRNFFPSKLGKVTKGDEGHVMTRTTPSNHPRDELQSAKLQSSQSKEVATLAHVVDHTSLISEGLLAEVLHTHPLAPPRTATSSASNLPDRSISPSIYPTIIKIACASKRVIQNMGSSGPSNHFMSDHQADAHPRSRLRGLRGPSLNQGIIYQCLNHHSYALLKAVFSSEGMPCIPSGVHGQESNV